jgi:hypothetical protein
MKETMAHSCTPENVTTPSHPPSHSDSPHSCISDLELEQFNNEMLTHPLLLQLVLLINVACHTWDNICSRRANYKSSTLSSSS